MQRFARIASGGVAEIITLPDDVALADAFHPDIAATCAPCGAEVQPGWVQSAGGFSAPVAAAPSLERLVAYAADKRWRVEVGGTVVGGVPISTDDRSKIMIMGARVAAAADAGWTTVWHGADGQTYPINATQMIAISDAVEAHVNATFATFASVKADIDAGDITTLAEIDAAFA